MDLKSFKEDLTTTQKRRLYDLQNELFESGKYKDKLHIQKECHDEALQTLIKEINDAMEKERK